MPKFYDLETLTQEDLNNLALERNSLKQKEEKLIKYLEDKLIIINEMLVEEQNIDKREYLLSMRLSYQDILEKVKSGKYE